ncbi:MAG TPA: hypothetical protein VN802_04860 [Stellaceae bacterium]|nr:hypothetical protein [Stellaceae bacterium]
MNTANTEPRSLERALAQEVVTASGARPADHVTIAGTDHVEVLVEFIRRGFSNVLCRSAEHGPHIPAPPADVLVAPDVKSEAGLSCVLARLGRDLRPRGILVMTCARTCSPFDERRLRRVLMDGGFTAVERIAGRGDVGTVWCAHKGAASLRHAA